MAAINARLGEASKEELFQILVAVCGHATTRTHVEGVLNYLEEKKSQEAEAVATRRSSRSSTRASSEVSQGSSQAAKTVKRTIKLCRMCEKPYEEKKNLSKSCSYHTGHLLIECEKDGLIWFDLLEAAAHEFITNPSALRILSCCNAEKDMSKGCVVGKHVAMAVELPDQSKEDGIGEPDSDN
ncbi:hypothetical protein CGRA01v4_09304 [Colletotrichum graminicola]|uniref:C2H2-type domain-containing protein n=1 Tax=Colletotrichum graminicola (strain M1.001 / M2 / FGSC 10212) TaxID=645133 RepID=E3QPG7_COLGM|nr:uncharacterized protein GLRG_07899 [Colletotrichum graminicola M1.001]EFQ32755.1 hypothetical protein GLRG_07899 [Colletotrichum graminicola M1.001]WDK18019.1 hypothetical protein CGRA01v4_09304 [Colletotrichum graminicola]